jgi:hypothetical protein
MPTKHKRLRSIIRKGGGGRFRGVQIVPAIRYGYRAEFKAPAYAIVYFDSRMTGSTMTMYVRGITAEKVKEHLRLSNARFGL